MSVPKAPAAGLELYFLVMYIKGPTWSPEVTEQVRSTQQEHLSYNAQMADKGIYKLAGPFEQPHDARWRGLLLVKAESLEAAHAIVAGDPAVKSGRLAFEISSVWLSADSLR